MLTTNIVFRILHADTAEDRRILLQLANTCAKAAGLFKRYRESLLSRTENLNPLPLEQAWAVPTNFEVASPPTRIAVLSELGHISPPELFGHMIMQRLPGGFDPPDLGRFTFDGLMEEMATTCHKFARPGKRSSNWNLSWLIAYCYGQLWKGSGLGVHWDDESSERKGLFLDQMETVLQHIGYSYRSRSALGYTVQKVLRKQKRLSQKARTRASFSTNPSL